MDYFLAKLKTCELKKQYIVSLDINENSLCPIVPHTCFGLSVSVVVLNVTSTYSQMSGAVQSEPALFSFSLFVLLCYIWC